MSSDGSSHILAATGAAVFCVCGGGVVLLKPDYCLRYQETIAWFLLVGHVPLITLQLFTGSPHKSSPLHTHARGGVLPHQGEQRCRPTMGSDPEPLCQLARVSAIVVLDVKKEAVHHYYPLSSDLLLTQPP